MRNAWGAAYTLVATVMQPVARGAAGHPRGRLISGLLRRGGTRITRAVSPRPRLAAAA